jgi:hypothetical protein
MTLKKLKMISERKSYWCTVLPRGARKNRTQMLGEYHAVIRSEGVERQPEEAAKADTAKVLMRKRAIQ